MAKYKKKPYIVDAIQLKNEMTLTVGDNTTNGIVGDWLVTDSTGLQFFENNTDFLQNYEIVQP